VINNRGEIQPTHTCCIVCETCTPSLGTLLVQAALRFLVSKSSIYIVIRIPTLVVSVHGDGKSRQSLAGLAALLLQQHLRSLRISRDLYQT